MSFIADDQIFPNNVLLALYNAATKLDPNPPTSGTPDVQVFRRALRTSDPNQSIGIVLADWLPEEDSQEIGNIEPTLNRYRFGVQGMVADGDQERGEAVHAVMAAAIRGMLYRDTSLRAILGGLRVDGADGSIERTGRWGVTRQVFLSSELSGSFLYLSTLEFWLETEIS